MDIRQELILRVLSAFNKEGIAEFTYQMLEDVCNKETIRLTLRELEKMGIIEKLNKNGFAFKYKLNKILDCPDFLFIRELAIKTKEAILEVYKYHKDYYTKSELMKIWNCKEGTVYNRKYRIQELTGKDINTLIKEIKIINKTFDTPYEVIDTDAGKQFKTNPASEEYYCFVCGETNPDKFNKIYHNICKKCQQKEAREKMKTWSLAKHLYYHGKNSRTGKKTKEKCELSIEDIESILNRQSYKCYYSGVDFSNVDYMKTSKLNKPSLDRLDSSKGYTLDNTVICTWQCNVAKNDSSELDFIKMCYNVAKNFKDNNIEKLKEAVLGSNS